MVSGKIAQSIVVELNFLHHPAIADYGHGFNRQAVGFRQFANRARVKPPMGIELHPLPPDRGG